MLIVNSFFFLLFLILNCCKWSEFLLLFIWFKKKKFVLYDLENNQWCCWKLKKNKQNKPYLCNNYFLYFKSRWFKSQLIWCSWNVKWYIVKYKLTKSQILLHGYSEKALIYWLEILYLLKTSWTHENSSLISRNYIYMYKVGLLIYYYMPTVG